jgi:hypothetical protein
MKCPTCDGSGIVPDSIKNPTMVAMGRKGGKLGGVARAKKLPSWRRREISQDAARARWWGIVPKR